MATTAPLERTIEATVPGVATAANDDRWAIGRAPFAGTVTAVTYTPEAAITGAATNHRAVRLVNRGQAGTGTTVVAELAFDDGVNATAYDEKTIPLSATAANLVLAEGDILDWFSDAILTGIADPGGLVRIALTRN